MVSDFNKDIPDTIRNEIKYVVKETKKTGKEHSLTFCRLKDSDRIFVSNYSAGGALGTDVNPCNIEHGHTEQIGDLHTHPISDRVMGITPSTADIVSTLEDSHRLNIPQVSCITSPDTKYISCYQPRPEVIQDKVKLRSYKSAMYFDESSPISISPYVRENVGKDFVHAWYNSKTFRRTTPTSKEVIDASFGKSKKIIKFDSVPELDKGAFCDLTEDLNYPTKDNRVAKECRKKLHIRELFGIRY